MSVSRTLILPAVLAAGVLAAQSSSAALVAIQDFENFGLSTVDGASPLARIFAIGGDGAIHTEVNSVFDQDSDRIFFRLMRVIQGEGGGGGVLNDILGGGVESEGVGSESASINGGTHGLFDALEVGGFQQFISNLASSYGAGLAAQGSSIPFIFSTTGSSFEFLPSFGGGFAPIQPVDSFSSDDGSDAAVAYAYSAAASQSQGVTSYGAIYNAIAAMGPNQMAVAPTPAQVEADVPAVIQAANDSAANQDSGADSQPILIATVIPEPTTSVMALCALGMLGLRRRRA